MDFQNLFALLLICSCLTGLVTEACKKAFPNRTSTNALAGIISIIVGVSVSIANAVLTNPEIGASYVLGSLFLVIGSWLCAMLGYDKVIQTITQFTKTTKE